MGENFIQNCVSTKGVSYKYKDAWYKVKNRNNIGDLSYLYDKYNPTSELDFYNQYVSDTTYTPDIRHRGRSETELNKICNDYMFYSNSTDFDEAYNNMIYHIIVETYRGHQKERDLMEYIRSKGYEVSKSSSEDDAKLGIDLICKKGNKKVFLQVKPISFFIGNGRWDLIQDRQLAFQKRTLAKQLYNCDTVFAIYKLNGDETEWLMNDKGGFSHRFESFLDYDGHTKGIINQGNTKKLP